MPDSAPSLQVNQRYRWFFSVTCDSKSLSGEPQSIDLEGLILRVDMNQKVSRKLEKATTPLDKFQIYAESGIWHEAITILAKLRKDNPGSQEIKTQWENLLAIFGFNDVAKAPILEYKAETSK